MDGELEHDASGPKNSEAWERVVADAAPCDHIVQLYQDSNFLNYAVWRFASGGFTKGEGIMLVATRTHWDSFRPRFESEGVDVSAAQERGQLTVVDADECLSRFMRGAMPDPPVFNAVFTDAVRQARARGNYQNLRVWGEMVDVLWERGDADASMNLEDLFDQLCKRTDIAIFCSFLMDNFHDDIQARMLPRLGTNHSHLIPVEDYGRLERAVSDALRETVGPDEALVLESRLLSNYKPTFKMPRAQALLMALRQVLPTVADPVLERSRSLYAVSGTA